jgi:hypothetical protein
MQQIIGEAMRVAGIGGIFNVYEAALRGTVKTYRATTLASPDPLIALQSAADEIEQIIRNEVIEHRGVIFSIVLTAALERSHEDIVEKTQVPVRSTNHLVFVNDDIKEEIATAASKVLTSLEELSLAGSGWTIAGIFSLDICIVKYNPLGAYVRLPYTLREKENKSVINMHDNNSATDDFCFQYAVLASLFSEHVVGKKSNPRSYDKYMKTIDFSHIKSPIPTGATQIAKFENTNKIGVNIFGYDEEQKEVFPMRVAKHCNIDEKTVDLLQINLEGKQHYFAVISLSALLRNQNNSYKYICRMCLHKFPEQGKLANHEEDCRLHSPQKVTYPEPGTTIKFKDIYKTQRVAFAIYADLECILEPSPQTQTQPAGKNESTTTATKTTAYQQHRVCSAAAFLYGDDEGSADGRTRLRFLHRAVEGGTNTVLRSFFETLVNWAQVVYVKTRRRMVWDNATDGQEFRAATHCSVCDKAFSIDNPAVRDHDHATGRFVYNIWKYLC